MGPRSPLQIIPGAGETPAKATEPWHLLSSARVSQVEGQNPRQPHQPLPARAFGWMATGQEQMIPCRVVGSFTRLSADRSLPFVQHERRPATDRMESALPRTKAEVEILEPEV